MATQQQRAIQPDPIAVVPIALTLLICLYAYLTIAP